MRRNIFTVVVLFFMLFSTSIFASQHRSPINLQKFCDGFEQGYKTGLKESGSSHGLYTDYCPNPPFKGYILPTSDYEHGHIVGLRRARGASY